MSTTAPALSAACTGWAATARYDVHLEDGATVLRPQDRERGTYRIRARGAGARVELTETEPDSDIEEPILFAAEIAVLERYVFGILGDDIRDDLALDELRLPWTTKDVAPGYVLSGMDRGWRTLSRRGSGPIAASRDETLSLVRLVPLSQFLTLTVDEVKRSFLHEAGRPLLVDGRYRSAGDGG